MIAEGISSNPGAVDQITGTGQAGEWLGFKKDSGVFLGGVWAARHKLFDVRRRTARFLELEQFAHP